MQSSRGKSKEAENAAFQKIDLVTVRKGKMKRPMNFRKKKLLKKNMGSWEANGKPTHLQLTKQNKTNLRQDGIR